MPDGKSPQGLVSSGRHLVEVADLLRVLTSPPEVRADVIRQFYERPEGRQMGEVLMALEEDDFARAAVVLALQTMDTGTDVRLDR